MNEVNKTVDNAWDGAQLKFTFRRNFSPEMYHQWEELVGLASSIVFNAEEDSVIWQYESKGKYSSSSLY